MNMASLKLVLPVLLLLCPAPTEANLSGVSPKKLPQEGGTPLVLIGDSRGGLLAGSAWAGNATVPYNLVLCCDFDGDSAPIGGESVASLRSATRGSCIVPKVNASGAAAVRLFLSVQKDCQGDKGPGGGWLTGQVDVQFSASKMAGEIILNDSDDDSDDDSDLGAGEIILIILGGIVSLVIGAAIIVCCLFFWSMSYMRHT
jgi:hypothetical protein